MFTLLAMRALEGAMSTLPAMRALEGTMYTLLAMCALEGTMLTLLTMCALVGTMLTLLAMCALEGEDVAGSIYHGGRAIECLKRAHSVLFMQISPSAQVKLAGGASGSLLAT